MKISAAPVRFQTLFAEIRGAPQKLSPEALHARQTAGLVELVQHAFANVPHYHRVFTEHGLRPEQIRGLDDLAKLPLLTKADVRAAGVELYEGGAIPKDGITRYTSGSTGNRLVLHQSDEDGFRLFCTWFRAYWSNGQRPWHRIALITDLDTVKKTKKPAVGTAPLLLWSGQDPREQVAALSDYRPQVIRGFNQSLGLLARAVLKAGVTGIRPKVVFGLGELSDARARASIQRAFGVPLSDVYACQEVGCIAWECPEQHRYHLNADNMIVEILKDGRPAAPGEPGLVVITSLALRQMPMIRYVLGDVASLSSARCLCGRGLPVLELLQGRADDFVTLPSGRVIPPIGTFAHVLEEEEAVIQYLVLQESPDRLVVKIVAPEVTGEAKERIHRGITTLVSGEAVVQVEVVEKIEQASNKMRRVISRVPLNL